MPFNVFVTRFFFLSITVGRIKDKNVFNKKEKPKNKCLCRYSLSAAFCRTPVSFSVVESADSTGHRDSWAWGDGGPLRAASCWEIVNIPGFNPTPQRLPGIIWPPYRKQAGAAGLFACETSSASRLRCPRCEPASRLKHLTGPVRVPPYQHLVLGWRVHTAP